jgi:hypothetical protein
MFHPLIQGDYYRPLFVDGKSVIDPEPVTTTIEPEVLLEGWRFSEFIGHVFSDVEGACRFYDRFATSKPIIEAEK